jgi:hypothetical protein
VVASGSAEGRVRVAGGVLDVAGLLEVKPRRHADLGLGRHDGAPEQQEGEREGQAEGSDGTSHDSVVLE